MTTSISGAKLALLAARARAESTEAHLLASEPIAIIGIGCRFPGGASSPAAFWEMLRSGTDAIRDSPPERASAAPCSGLLDDRDQFDPVFFGISPREASVMDPQHRLALEVAWEALWDAGCAPGTLAGSPTGVFMSVSSSDYARLLAEDPASIGPYTTAGSELSMGSGRVSFLLDLRGPSVVVDTACSSSLIAIHLACQSLRSGETRMTLAGGVTLKFTPDHYAGLAKMGMLAGDGRSKTFDARANGFVPGEGCGLVVLKRLADALADGDRIYALIRGTAANQDGRTSTITAPNGLAQQQVIRAALENARVGAAEIGYVETHGTGTVLGDPIEVEALAAVLDTPGAQPCALGAVKTNIGHLEVTAGAAGLIKAALALHHEAIPPNLHFQSLNPHIELEGTRLFLPTATTPWKRGGRARFAGVSAFGFSGTNGHLVLEEAPVAPKRRTAADEEGAAVVLPISARTPEALDALAGRYRDFLDSEPAGAYSAAEIAAAASSRRDHYEERLAVVGSSHDELRLRLGDAAAGRWGAHMSRGRAPADAPETVFLFAGQGSQWPRMGMGLIGREPVFRAAIEECDALLKVHAGWSLTEVLSAGEGPSRLKATEYAQPAICALEIALARLLASWGIIPSMVIGHSAGEIAAANIAGTLSLGEAMRLIAHRGRIMQAASSMGRMVSVSLPAAEVSRDIEPYQGCVSIAAINSWRTTVVSGAPECLETLSGQWRAHGVECRTLPVDYAFHSAQMDSLLPQLEKAFGQVKADPCAIPLISTVTGLNAAGPELGASYWVRAVRQPVLYWQAVEAAISGGARCFVEIGPHAVLGLDTAETVRRAAKTFPVIATLRRGRAERESLLDAVSNLYTAGHKPCWEKIAGGRGPVIALPAYPYQRQRYWLDSCQPRASAQHSQANGCFTLTEMDSPAIRGRVFEALIDLRTSLFLADHLIAGAPVFPLTGFIDLALHAAQQTGLRVPLGLEDLTVVQPLILSADQPVRLQVAIEAGSLRVYSKSPTAWQLHASARIESVVSGDMLGQSAEMGPWESLDPAQFYDRAHRRGNHFGPSFQLIRSLRRRGNVVESAIAYESGSSGTWAFHPALFDACLQTIVAGIEGDATYMPIAIDSLRVLRPAGCEVSCRLEVRPVVPGQSGGRTADFVVNSPGGECIALGRGFHIRPALAAFGQPVESHTCAVRWVPAEAAAATRPGLDEALVIGERDGIAGDLCMALERGGTRCELRDWSAGDVLAETDRQPLVVLAPGAPVVDAPDPMEELEAVCRRVLEALQRITGQPNCEVREVWVVTRDAHRVLVTDTCAGFAHAPVWGLVRSVALEHPGIRWTRCDLDESPASRELLVRAIRGGVTEDELALRAGQLYIPHLEPLAADSALRPSRLAIGERGSVNGLRFEPLQVQPVPANRVAVEVHTSALNFRDVLNVLGAYPGDAGPLGVEFCGRVLSVGSQASGIRSGDRVMGLGWGSLRDVLMANPELLTHVPDNLTDEEAVTLPNAFATAYHSLVERARLRAGERVLIHAAAGGVGLMATQLAQHLGAEVFATAGSVKKRRLLRGLGVQHVFDSRSTEFVSQILEATAGEGVDVSLNSLTGAFLDATILATCRGGRFIEIGKADIRTAAGIDALGRALEYHVVDLGEFVDGEPTRIAEHLRRLQEYLASGAIHPLPRHVFRFEDAPAAFRFMERAGHVGKIALRHRAGREFAPGGSWMITGGMGALGLGLAEWFGSHGVERLLLVGRSAPNDEGLARIQALRKKGVAVEICTADLSGSDAVGIIDSLLRGSQPPVRGIAHLAGVTDDGVLGQQTWDRFQRVLAPKVRGGWLVHELASRHGVPDVVMFSSIAAVLGSAGQASYAAANAFLDSLAQYRSGRGEPTLSINWGAWAESGMAARLAAQGKRLGLQLVQPMSAAECLQTIPPLMRSGFAQGAVFSADPHAATSPAVDRLTALVGPSRTERPSMAPVKPQRPRIAQLVETLPRAEALPLLVDYLRGEVRLVIGLPPNHPIDEFQPLMKIGLDSLMALEMRNRVTTAMGRQFSATLLFDYPTLGALAGFLLPTAGAMEHAGRDGALDEISALSDEEAERLLAQELEGVARRI